MRKAVEFLRSSFSTSLTSLLARASDFLSRYARAWLFSTSTSERVISVGDCAVIPAAEEHWHGAADTGSPMSHLAITQAGSVTEVVDA